MDKTVLAIRAVTSEYAKRWLWLPLAAAIGVYIVILLIAWWLAASISAWWWLVIILPTFVFLIALTLWIIARIVVARLAPEMNKPQKKAARDFVGRIDKVAEHIGTPKYVVLFRILKDAAIRSPSNRTYIGEIAHEPGEMHRAFDRLRSLF